MLRYADITDDSYEPYVEDINTRINNIISDYLPKSGGTISGSLTVNGALKTERSGALLLSVTSESGSISGNIPGLENYTAFLVSLTIKSNTGNSYAYNRLVLPVQYIISESGYYPDVTLTFADGTFKSASIACTITGDTLTLKQQVPGAGNITKMTVYNLI